MARVSHPPEKLPPGNPAAYKKAVADCQWVDANVPMPEVLALSGIRAEAGKRTTCPICLEPDPRVMVVHDHYVYCFGCCTGYGPVRFHAIMHDLRPGKAARELMRLTGRNPSVDRLLQRPGPRRLDTGRLSTSMRAWCAGKFIDDWVVAQYEPDVAGPLSRLLGLLEQVTTEAELHEWWDKGKRIMTAAVARWRAAS